MARKKKPRTRRTKTQHPGVKIRSRTWAGGEVSYFARWRDPATGREVDTNLSKLGLTSDEVRRAWAIRKAKAIARETAALEIGEEREQTDTPLEAGVAAFLVSLEQRARPDGVRSYRECLGQFLAWGSKRRAGRVEDLTRALLADFRETVIAAPKQSAKKGVGAGRGGKREAKARRSPHTINRVLRHVKAAVNHWRRLGMTPRLDSDAIRDGLANVRTPRVLPEYLPPEDVRRLLEAALRHDEATFDMTRSEKAGSIGRGSTLRHPPIAPFLATVLLTGCRVAEVVALEWDWIRLDALDEFGQAVGEIRIPASIAKTHHERVVDMAVSPALRSLLAALYLRRGERASVFGASKALVEAARKRLVGTFGAPAFSWQILRETCSTFLVNSSGIFGAASAYRAARQLGHGVAIAEKHYMGLVRGIPREARTLEDAMQVADLLLAIVARASGKPTEREMHASGT